MRGIIRYEAAAGCILLEKVRGDVIEKSADIMMTGIKDTDGSTALKAPRHAEEHCGCFAWAYQLCTYIYSCFTHINFNYITGTRNFNFSYCADYYF